MAALVLAAGAGGGAVPHAGLGFLKVQPQVWTVPRLIATKQAGVAALSLGYLRYQQGDLDGARAAFQIATDSGDAELAPHGARRLGEPAHVADMYSPGKACV
jgi:hypothetical protein